MFSVESNEVYRGRHSSLADGRPAYRYHSSLFNFLAPPRPLIEARSACAVASEPPMFVFYSNTVGLVASILISIALTLLLLYACSV